MERKLPLGTLPVASTSFTSHSVFEAPGGHAILRFDYEIDGESRRGGLRFDKVRAFRYRAEGHCTLWHVDGVYDTLAEIAESEWVSELSAANSTGQWEIHHFMIYVDSAGCYEIAAGSWAWLSEDARQ